MARPMWDSEALLNKVDFLVVYSLRCPFVGNQEDRTHKLGVQRGGCAFLQEVPHFRVAFVAQGNGLLLDLLSRQAASFPEATNNALGVDAFFHEGFGLPQEFSSKDDYCGCSIPNLELQEQE